MAQKMKIKVKERFSDGEIDLSMSDLDDVPVKEIALLKKTVSLDLSNNRLTILPSNFTTLSFLTKLDLSKNELTELPEDFGRLSKLKYLDLYRNKLERLPLSFAQLGALKFLDLKDNPLVPAIAKVAGPCVDTKGCQQCARDIVKLFKQLQKEVDSEVEMRQKARQKQLQINQQKRQEEKKKLKKEKQPAYTNMSYQEIKTFMKEMEPNISKKKSKKDQKKNKPSHKSCNRFLLVVLTFSILWFMFALRLPPSEILVPKIIDYYEIFLKKLPTDYQHYGQSFGSSICLLQDSTRNMSIHCMDIVYNSQIFQQIARTVGDFVHKIFGSYF